MKSFLADAHDVFGLLLNLSLIKLCHWNNAGVKTLVVTA